MRFYFSVCLIGLGVFVWFPELDLTVSGLFYRPEDGFIYKDLPWVQLLYRTFAWLQIPILLVLVLGLALGVWFDAWARQRMALLFLLISLLLGPGLIVNEGLKNHWGRARPVQITEFGGSARYSPPWQISDQCERNCAMSSGHAALGFYPMALGWVLRRHRRAWWWVGGMTGAAVGLGRILQGGHFLSDVLVSAALVWLVCELLSRWLLPREDKLTAPSCPE